MACQEEEEVEVWADTAMAIQEDFLAATADLPSGSAENYISVK